MYNVCLLKIDQFCLSSLSAIYHDEIMTGDFLWQTRYDILWQKITETGWRLGQKMTQWGNVTEWGGNRCKKCLYADFYSWALKITDFTDLWRRNMFDIWKICKSITHLNLLTLLNSSTWKNNSLTFNDMHAFTPYLFVT